MATPHCKYDRLADGRLRCPACGDETRHVWPTDSTVWPRNLCKALPAEPYLPGPGDWLHESILLLGLSPHTACQCREMLGRMNNWAPIGCREHRAEIVEHLRTAYKALSWPEWLAALTKAAASGLVLTLNPLDPFGSLVDQAIGRAEATLLAHNKD